MTQHSHGRAHVRISARRTQSTHSIRSSTNSNSTSTSLSSNLNHPAGRMDPELVVPKKVQCILCNSVIGKSEREQHREGCRQKNVGWRDHFMKYVKTGGRTKDQGFEVNDEDIRRAKRRSAAYELRSEDMRGESSSSSRVAQPRAAPTIGDWIVPATAQSHAQTVNPKQTAPPSPTAHRSRRKSVVLPATTSSALLNEDSLRAHDRMHRHVPYNPVNVNQHAGMSRPPPSYRTAMLDVSAPPAFNPFSSIARGRRYTPGTCAPLAIQTNVNVNRLGLDIQDLALQNGHGDQNIHSESTRTSRHHYSHSDSSQASTAIDIPGGRKGWRFTPDDDF